MFLREHLDEVCSDLSVFHQIGDYTELDSVTFFKLAWLLGNYQGCMAAVIGRLRDSGPQPQPVPIPAAKPEPPAATAEVLASPAFGANPQLGFDVPIFSYESHPRPD